MTRIDCRVEATVAAEPDAVWNVLADIERWPEWNPSCAAAEVDGPLEGRPAARLRLVHPRGRVFHTRPRVESIDPPGRLSWVARATGAQAPHRGDAHPRRDETVVELTTSVSGPMAFSYRWVMRPKTQALLYGTMLGGLVERFE
ncbi:MAG: SRPBCC family protein [Thermoleophilia bacterium]